MNSNQPPWLKAMQNGAIGEARAKAFLLNRFWVLERSVDIDGADFIIQRRLSGKNILDSQAPKLGVIQVKFYGTEATTHYIHKEYVVNEKHEPRIDFFLLCHSGEENDESTFLITSEEIVKNFPLSNIQGSDKYRISFPKILTGGFIVKNKTRALDRIEHALSLADFKSNRIFLSWALPSVRADLEGIEPVYKEDISNWYGDLPTSFFNYKKTVQKAMADVEEVYELLSQLAVEHEPMNAVHIVDEIAFKCHTGYGWNIPLPDELDNEDFFDACRQHKEIVSNLKSIGLLDAYIDFKKEIKKAFFSNIKKQFPIHKNQVCAVSIYYDFDDLSLKKLNVTILDATDYFKCPAKPNQYGMVDIGTFDYAKVVNISTHHIELYFMPGRYGGFKSKNDEDLFEEYLMTDFSVFKECMEKIYALKFVQDN